MSVILKNVTTLKLTADTTINLDNSMTAAQIQALIDAQPKDLGGYTLTFQFADGTYNLDDKLTFRGFHSGNSVKIYGNTSDSSLSTTKAVSLDFSSYDGNGISINDCSARVYVYSLKITVNTNSTNRQAIVVDNSTCVRAYYDYLLGTSTTYGYLFLSQMSGSVYIYNTYFSNAYVGIFAATSKVSLNSNDDTGTAPKYGIYIGIGGLVGKTGTQPAGSVANEYYGASLILS